MKVKIKRSDFLLHILGWGVVLLVNMLVARNLNYSSYDWGFTFISCLTCIVTFYIAYALLTPGLLFRHRLGWYILSMSALFVMSFVTTKVLHVTYFQMTLEERSRELRNIAGMTFKPGPVQVIPSMVGGDDTIRLFPASSILDITRHSDTMQLLSIADTISIYPRRVINYEVVSDTLVVSKREEKMEYTIIDDTLRVYKFNDRHFSIAVRPILPIDSATVSHIIYSKEKEKKQTPPPPKQYQREMWRIQFRHSPYNPFSRRNQSLFYTLIMTMTASITISFIKRWKQEERKNSEIEREKTEAELAYLKQQINPHFLFNTLNAIYSYTLAVPTPASDAIIKLSSMLRYMLYDTSRSTAKLSDELHVVSDYIELQRLRLTEHTQVSFRIDGKTDGFRIEPMLLIPILENAFKFGVDSLEESFINILVTITPVGAFAFETTNRVVVATKPSDRNSGIGIKNIRRRLDLIYGENYTFETGESHGVFHVVLKLNLKKENGKS